MRWPEFKSAEFFFLATPCFLLATPSWGGQQRTWGGQTNLCILYQLCKIQIKSLQDGQNDPLRYLPIFWAKIRIFKSKFIGLKLAHIYV